MSNQKINQGLMTPVGKKTLLDDPHSIEREAGETMPSLTCKVYVEAARTHCEAQSFVTIGHQWVILNMCEYNALSLYFIR